jgi:predicted HAD superfamily Cof-like phosphohydrolase
MKINYGDGTIPKQNLVRRFMEHFGQQVPEDKGFPEIYTVDQRCQLIKEELAELWASTNNVDYLDAVIDLLYVVYGAAVEAGFNADTIDQAFLEVHRSNMSKLWTDREKADYSGSDLVFEPRFDKWIAKRGGKVIKSPSYSPAQLERFCNE